MKFLGTILALIILWSLIAIVYGDYETSHQKCPMTSYNPTTDTCY